VRDRVLHLNGMELGRSAPTGQSAGMVGILQTFGVNNGGNDLKSWSAAWEQYQWPRRLFLTRHLHTDTSPAYMHMMH